MRFNQKNANEYIWRQISGNAQGSWEAEQQGPQGFAESGPFIMKTLLRGNGSRRAGVTWAVDQEASSD